MHDEGVGINGNMGGIHAANTPNIKNIQCGNQLSSLFGQNIVRGGRKCIYTDNSFHQSVLNQLFLLMCDKEVIEV